MVDEEKNKKESDSESTGREIGRLAGRRFGKQLAGRVAGQASGAGAGSATGAAGGTAAGAAGGAAAGTAAGAGAGAAAGGAVGAAGGPAAPVTVPLAAIGAAAIGAVAGKFFKYILTAAVGIGLFVIVFFFIFLTVIVSIFVGSRAGASPTGILQVTKTASPSHLENGSKAGDTATVVYTITVKNTGKEAATNVRFNDDKCPAISAIAPLPKLDPGASHTESISCSVATFPQDYVHQNTVSVSGTIPGEPSSALGELSYYIKYGETSILPANPQEIKNLANSSWPDNNINKTCLGGISCWDYVIQQSIAHGISPAFAITIWWEEGGFGGLVGDRRAASEFGCFPNGDLSQTLTFQESFNCFLEFTSNEHPYQTSDPQGSFTEWVKYFCGPGAVPICSNNPTFLSRLKDVYEQVAPGQIYLVTAGQPVGKQIFGNATAIVVIGVPPEGPPGFSPLKGPVQMTQAFKNPDSDYKCGFHLGIDIVTQSSDWNVYSPFPGVAIVDYVNSDPNNSSGYGEYVDLRSGVWIVRLAHMDPVHVRQGDVVGANTVLGVMDHTGFVKSTSGTGDHVHYELGDPNLASGCNTTSLLDPAEFGALIPHP